MSATAHYHIKFPYQKLKHDADDDDDGDHFPAEFRQQIRELKVVRKVAIKRRCKLITVPSLRKFLRRRLRLRILKLSYSKIVKRFKEGQCYFGDLFAGNYFFIQVNPTSLKSLQRRVTLHSTYSSSKI